MSFKGFYFEIKTINQLRLPCLYLSKLIDTSSHVFDKMKEKIVNINNML